MNRQNDDLKALHPWFVGAYAENHKILEELILDMLRDHIFWRRNFHPEAIPPIPTSAQYREDYADFVANLKHELYRLSADLKQSVPFFSPRYIGHMASDLLLPGLIARIGTELYNPNNITEDVSPVTLMQENRVGEQLATMMGYSIDGPIRAFGHLTSGGTVANYEGALNLLAARLYPLAVLEANELLGANIMWRGQALTKYPKNHIANLSVEEAISLKQEAEQHAQQRGIANWSDAVESSRYESLGLVEFYRRHPDLGPLQIMVATTGHYSWEKTMKLLGLGKQQLVHIRVDGAMRMDTGALHDALDVAQKQNATVICVVPILGNTEFGAIDPIDAIVEARRQYRTERFEFGIHVDAAWGGYLRTLFNTPEGSFHSREDVSSMFKYFPSPQVYQAFEAIAHTDSATVDPHKLGFIPYSAGAYIAKNREIVSFIQQKAAYVFDAAEPVDILPLGQYTLEGSRPGAAVASAYVTHRTIPLHSKGFGKIIAQSIRSCEAFWERASVAAKRVEDIATLVVPFEPDTNLVCVALNLKGNTDIASSNAFTDAVMHPMKTDKKQPVQDRQFFVSSTKLFLRQIDPQLAGHVLDALGVTQYTDDDHVLLMRHTLMNPWLLSTRGEEHYIEQYFQYLESRIRAVAEH